MIAENKLVALNYILKENNPEGVVLEDTTNSKPLEFIYGLQNMIPGFEDGIKGLKGGDKFDFTINHQDAYGPVNPQAIIDLDINIFSVNGEIDHEMLKVGNVIPMQDSNGGRLNGNVLEVNDSKVKMDFNHPLAGKDLYFEGDIISVRDASQEEIEATMNPSSCCGGGGGHDHNSDSCGTGNGGGCGCSC